MFSVVRRKGACAAGGFVGVVAGSQISINSVDGAPRQQDAQDESHRGCRQDFPPIGSIHQRLQELTCSLGEHIDTDSILAGNAPLLLQVAEDDDPQGSVLV